MDILFGMPIRNLIKQDLIEVSRDYCMKSINYLEQFLTLLISEFSSRFSFGILHFLLVNDERYMSNSLLDFSQRRSKRIGFLLFSFKQ